MSAMVAEPRLDEATAVVDVPRPERKRVVVALSRQRSLPVADDIA